MEEQEQRPVTLNDSRNFEKRCLVRVLDGRDLFSTWLRPSLFFTCLREIGMATNKVRKINIKLDIGTARGWLERLVRCSVGLR